METDFLSLLAFKSGNFRVNYSKGTIYSKKTRKYIGGHNTKGYQVFTLHFEGNRKQIKTHRFIWISKHGMPPKGLVVDHKNRRKGDNRLINLRLVSDKGNANNRRRYTGEQNPAAKLTKSIAKSIRKEYKTLKSYQKLADKYEVSKSLIAGIIKNRIWA